MVDGKAKLLRDDYCDGLGDCLPACEAGAITFEEREADEYNEAEVKKNQAAKQAIQENLACGCPGTHAKSFTPASAESQQTQVQTPAASELRQWPVQIKLAPVGAPYFEGANLLISADCAAYAYGNFHQEFMKNKVTLIGCPKLDQTDYSEKLTEIIKNNNIKSVTVVRMEVPCCGGIEHAVKTALQNAGKMIPWQVVTLSTDGKRLDS